MIDSWPLFEPSTGGRFERLDRFLLRRALERGYKGLTGRTAQVDPAGFANRVDDMLKLLPSLGTSANVWRDFLPRKTQTADPTVLVDADATKSSNDGELARQVFSRGLLLLRVASGSVGALVRSAGIAGADLRVWWESEGQERGLWAEGNSPDSLLDLWADIEVALAQTTVWTEAPQSDLFVPRWRDQDPLAYDDLSSYERIALWSLAS